MNPTTSPFESDILALVSNYVQETLLLFAPATWPDQDLDAMERVVLDRTRKALNMVDQIEFSIPDVTRHLAQSAVHHTKHLILQTNVSRSKWAYPDDGDLATLQITVPAEFLADIDHAVIKFGLEDREQCAALAIEFAMQTLLDPKGSAYSS